MSISGQFFGKDDQSESPPAPKPPVDLDKPVENRELSAAIAAFTQSCNLKAEEELTHQLHRGVFLVPMLTDEMKITSDAKAGSAAVQPGSVIKMLSCIDDAGLAHLPLFTDWPAIRAWTDQPVATVVMSAAEAWDFVLSQAHYAGAVVNPGACALPLSRPLLQHLKDGQKPRGLFRTHVPNKIELTAPVNIQTRRAHAVEAKLAGEVRHVCEANPHIMACYLLDARKPETGEIALIIAVTIDDEPAHMDSVALQFQAMLRQFPAQAVNTYIMSSGGFIERYAGSEFYVRTAVS